MKLTGKTIVNMNVEYTVKASLVEHAIPEHLHDGIIRYLVSGIEPGSFLFSVFANDLLKGVNGADDDLTMKQLQALAKWIYWEAPSACNGSRRAVQNWIEMKRKEAEL